MLKNQIHGACEFLLTVQLCYYTHIYRGVILFAMVCGRLPFGDDSQVKQQQKQGVVFPPSKPISSDARELITNTLNTKVKERFDTYDMILDDWTASLPVRVPSPLSAKPKYTTESCIPTICGQPPQVSTLSCTSPRLQQHVPVAPVIQARTPFRTRIGLSGRKITDAICDVNTPSGPVDSSVDPHRERTPM